MNDRTDFEDASVLAGERTSDESRTLPILRGKDYSAPSVFRPEALLREARRQKNQFTLSVPDICVLDLTATLSAI